MTTVAPIRVGLIHIDHSAHRDGTRRIGAWSYAVPEFDVTHIPVPKTFVLNRDDWRDRVDVLIWEDSRTSGTLTGTATLPTAYVVGDSTLSWDHYQIRRTEAAKCDLILVDWDRLDRFSDLAPTHRLSYCVNEALFYPRDKTTDVGFYVNGTLERDALHYWLTDFCAAHGYSYSGGTKMGEAYTGGIGSTRVNINLNRNPETRAHRCFDVMASRSCLLTSPLCDVSGEVRTAGVQYREYKTLTELGDHIHDLLAGAWSAVADAGYTLVQQHHTWAVRARELAALLRETLGVEGVHQPAEKTA